MSHQEQVDPIHGPNLAINDAALAKVRNLTSPIAGVCAGVIGMTGVSGFVMYLVWCVSVSVGFWVLVVGRGDGGGGQGDRIAQALGKGRGGEGLGAERYFKGGVGGMAIEAVTNGSITGYLLTWTLFYGLVHVYN
ncbi:hypothetical protein PYCC9005_000665 [Savitreella phatthalungensis]